MPRLMLTMLLVWVICQFSAAQSNLLCTSLEAESVLKGNFNPADYAPAMAINDPAAIAEALATQISTDSLRAYLEQMSAFGNRNTGSDTLSATFGIGAARRWVYQKFEAISAQHENRLLASYLQFDATVCNITGSHRNIFAVLPGQGPQFDEVVLVEAHLDSRCENACDFICDAHGMEDNGSGSALVIELARLLSAYSFNRTMVFLLTTGEEQGLFGAEAFAAYCQLQNIKLKAVFNNDIVGGIICGATASPPGCPGLNSIDSINVRLYSQGTINSRNKQLARFSKLEYAENLREYMAVKPVINLMTPEDRTGRGGDHIPFRESGYPAIRFTSANEHGNGNPATPDYSDRQHTMADVLGLDTNNDGTLDSFFVDMNYLARNTAINGNALAMAASGPVPPVNFTLANVNGGFRVAFDDPYNYGVYRVGVREYGVNDWDTVFTIFQTIDTLYGLEPATLYVLSAASVDNQGIESLFSNEKFDSFTTGSEPVQKPVSDLVLLQNHPNPFDEATVIGVQVNQAPTYNQAFIAVQDLQGKTLAQLPITLHPGLNEVVYDYQYHQYTPGAYVYSLVVDGQLVESKQMIYAY